MKISEIMSQDVTVARPQDSLQSVAKQMAAIDAGSIPVCDGERLQGMITDRDIVIRAVSEGRSFDTAVSEVMTAGVEYCYDDDDIGAAADKMAELQVRRLPVLNREQRLVGIVALGDIARQAKDRTTGQTLEEISEPSR
ncbi:CBS domain-containing protein [Phenylobacterium sp.]|uniref:CBS domain-containing protein n=1 Tax=Phenylobacterium sp. TaxID=1871053 RepID=UPI0039836C7E